VKNWNLIFRRTHLYLGMLLVPWVLIYALSTVALNHAETFRPYRADGRSWLSVSEKDYAIDVPAGGGDALRGTATRILADQGVTSAFGVQRQGPRLNITVPHFIQPARFVYDSETKKLRREKRSFSAVELLVRLHERTGYGRGGFLNNLWAFVVDLFCVTTLVWIGTGLYLWWKLANTRAWGFAAIGGGAATIVILLFSV
jgi:hypothetical protein